MIYTDNIVHLDIDGELDLDLALVYNTNNAYIRYSNAKSFALGWDFNFTKINTAVNMHEDDILSSITLSDGSSYELKKLIIDNYSDRKEVEIVDYPYSDLKLYIDKNSQCKNATFILEHTDGKRKYFGKMVI